MRVSIYRVKNPGRDLFRWVARVGGTDEVARGGPQLWMSNDNEIEDFLRKRRRRLARRGICESVRVQMAN